MTEQFLKSTFETTYKDDFKDSDNYHRILFNSGRALQARELIQMQTIIQEEVRRFADNIFKDGSVVTPGGLSLNNSLEFVKLEGNPTITTYQVGQTLTDTSGVTAEIVAIAAYEDASNPATFYIKYTSTTAGTPGNTPVRFTNSDTITNGITPVQIQIANTIENPAVGRGTQLSVSTGSFYAQGHFVQCNPQSIFVDRYSSTPTKNVGFRVVEDIVTTDDNDALFDNQNVLPNQSAPGADRYRIQLILTNEEDVEADQNFILLNRIDRGQFVDEIDLSTYNIIGDEMATRTFEESGNYTVTAFNATFADSDDNTKLKLDVDTGVAYVNGYRVSKTAPTAISVNKAQDTGTIDNDVVAANFGNYVKIEGSSVLGIPNVDILETVNLRNATNYGGSTIGTARVRHVERDGVDFRWYLFDVQMDNGQNFRDVRSIGLSSTFRGNPILENSNAVIKEANNNNLFFDMSNERPSALNSISLTTQRRFTDVTTGLGVSSLTVTGTETFSNTTQWIVSRTDTGDIVTPSSITGAGTQGVSIDGLPVSTNVEIIAYVNNSAGTVRTKTLTETTTTASIDSDGDGVRFIPLTKADVYLVSRVRSEDSDGDDLSNRFILDNGQRDNFYAQGRLILDASFTPPTDPVFVRYQYFDHGANGHFFAVNSYNGQVDYEEIPAYVQANGELIELRNVLDFRARKGDLDSDFTVSSGVIHELPANTDLIEADVTYYLPRRDILAINNSGAFQYITGTSQFDPQFPPLPTTAMDLYQVEMNAYTDNSNDLTITPIANKRYTMRDIGKIEKRIDNLEEVTALNLLELETSTIEVLDSNGNNRFKNGFFADNFKSFDFAAIESNEFRASIDINNDEVRPGFNTKNVRIMLDSEASTNVTLSGDNVYLSYEDSAVISQILASDTENVNPFSIITNEGSMVLSPSSDIWTTVRRTFVDSRGRQVPGRQRRTVQRLVARSQFGPWNNVRTFRSLGGSSELLPFIRSRRVSFHARGLKPLTEHFAFFDGQDVAALIREETDFSRISRTSNFLDQPRWRNNDVHPSTASALVSDANGEIIGSFFIPGDTFAAGEREFKILDISANNDDGATSIARASYFAQGTLDRRTFDIRPVRRDPLAQSFRLPNVDMPFGGFVSKIGVFFSTRPDNDVPVQIEIRPLENGVPSQNQVLPGSITSVNRDDVVIPGDTNNLTSVQGAETQFVFDEPVYLEPGNSYAFVLSADTTDYNVYVARAGDFHLGTTESRIKRQPTMGSLFLSQNAITWTPDQMRDMMFNLYCASFNTSLTGEAIIENVDLADDLLDADPFLTDSGSPTVTVISPNHGLVINDVVTFTGVDSSADIGGIMGTSILGDRTITKVDGTGFTFDADSDATSTVRAGGNDNLVTQNAMFDAIVPAIGNFIPEETNMTFVANYTDGVSLSTANNVTNAAYGKSSTDEPFIPDEQVVFDTPRMIAGAKLEEAELGAGVRSLTIKGTMTTTNKWVSPVINLQRSDMLLVSNRIDNQDSDASVVAPFNNPITWVDETDPASGTHIAKHVTNAINLEEAAVGLKIIAAMNRPSVAEVDLYYRVIDTGSDDNIQDKSWIYVEEETNNPTDNNRDIFRDYQYLIGGQGGNLDPFTTFQLKFVFRSSNSSRVPRLRDLRTIALGT